MSTPSPLLTAITPTTGRASLDALVESIDGQTAHAMVYHILLWDDVRAQGAREPRSYDGPDRLSLVLQAAAEETARRRVPRCARSG